MILNDFERSSDTVIQARHSRLQASTRCKWQDFIPTLLIIGGKRAKTAFMSHFHGTLADFHRKDKSRFQKAQTGAPQ